MVNGVVDSGCLHLERLSGPPGSGRHPYGAEGFGPESWTSAIYRPPNTPSALASGCALACSLLALMSALDACTASRPMMATQSFPSSAPAHPVWHSLLQWVGRNLFYMMCDLNAYYLLPFFPGRLAQWIARCSPKAEVRSSSLRVVVLNRNKFCFSDCLMTA